MRKTTKPPADTSGPVAEGVRKPRSRKPGKADQPFSADELRRISAEITAGWSQPVQATGLTLLEVDPWRVHAYWNLPEAELAAARARLAGTGELVLRFSDISPQTGVSATPHGRFDIQVRGARNTWYVDLWRDAKHYSADLGLRGADGAFEVLARSNEVFTPRASPSPELAFSQLEVRPPAAPPAARPVNGEIPSAQLLRDLYPRRPPLQDSYPLAMAETSGVPLEEPAFPELVPEIDAWVTAPRDDRVMDRPTDGPAFPAIDPAEIEPYQAQARKNKARLLKRLGAPLPAPSAAMVAPTDQDFTPQPLPVRPTGSPPEPFRAMPGGTTSASAPSSAEVPASEPPAAQPVLSLEALLAGTATSPGQPGDATRVSAQLVIQGQVQPGSLLTLFGERLEVAPDGGFTTRLPLERGPQLLALLHHLRGLLRDRGGG
jgi:hypothetical protein